MSTGEPDAEFYYHRSVAPTLWVLFALAATEMLAVHLFIVAKWPRVSWPLLLLTLAGLVWLVVAIRSMPCMPHRIDGDRLLLFAGRLKRVEVPLADICEVRSSFTGEEVREGTRNLALAAYPNRLIERRTPGRRSRIGVRLDNPSTFDAALRMRGVDVR
ncbi:hypothetical protein HMF7854_08885 [Sphingomonas ginkgonis]|uniref:PH domain-containing protein n=1 Tax=Sphingomonas ginkgonis TaxID=2315330 RepID=A0A429VAI4_9SPHN|nr:hypothetical protein [Sphingomonas ginkgonis]RST30935.1 hypothetical protein HMF7854_08885 [Sphingomonas ginkgonis]